MCQLHSKLLTPCRSTGFWWHPTIYYYC